MTVKPLSHRIVRSKNATAQVSRRVFPSGIRRKLLCLAIILTLLSTPGLSIAMQQAPVLASTAVDATASSLRNVGAFLKWFLGKNVPAPVRQEGLAERKYRVSAVRISPSHLVGYVGDTHTFTAIGTDSSGEIVHGIRFDWESSGGTTTQVTINEAGRAAFVQPGMYIITCRAGSAVGTATVLVRPGPRPRQTDEQWKADQESLQTSTTGPLGSDGVFRALLDKLVPTAHAQGGGGNDIGLSAAVGVVGSPPYSGLEPTRLGPVLPKENFSIGIPLVSLGGRGLGASISAYYNSNVWGARFDPILNKTVYTFDPIQSWPSPGFTIGFGRIAYYDWQADFTYAYMLIDPDGTRHHMGRGHQSNQNTLQTTDGTHVTFVGSVTGGGTLYYQDGTKVTIALVNNRLLPTQVTTTDGNYSQLAYKQASQGFAPMALDYVVDSLGRVIQFAYSGTSLISINPPSGYAASFSYQTVTMNTNFQNEIVVENVGSSFQGVSTLTAGYRPPYTFTYSGYGLIYGISWSSGGQSGSVTYNYPTGGEELYAGPTFSQRTETATNSPTGVYTYSGNVITRPDGSTLTLTPGSNGLAQSEVKNSSGVSFARTVFTYANDPGGSPQMLSVTSYDDTSTPSKVEFDYDQYGNVLNQREYGWKIGGLWKVRRRTHYTYLDYQQYIDAYIRNRVIKVEVFDALENTSDADDVLVGKSEFQYDNYGAMGGMEMYSGAPLPPGWLYSYGSVTTRGKMTGVTKWTNLQG
ncbi:MAG TPA: hypothetical protein VJS64_03230, partial [Pyrinomonadaceae bacterium]|nr:hypothetical protein [Pyrinomonadaceae bacterium]